MNQNNTNQGKTKEGKDPYQFEAFNKSIEQYFVFFNKPLEIETNDSINTTTINGSSCLVVKRLAMLKYELRDKNSDFFKRHNQIRLLLPKALQSIDPEKSFQIQLLIALYFNECNSICCLLNDDFIKVIKQNEVQTTIATIINDPFLQPAMMSYAKKFQNLKSELETALPSKQQLQQYEEMVGLRKKLIQQINQIIQFLNITEPQQMNVILIKDPFKNVFAKLLMQTQQLDKLNKIYNQKDSQETLDQELIQVKIKQITKKLLIDVLDVQISEMEYHRYFINTYILQLTLVLMELTLSLIDTNTFLFKAQMEIKQLNIQISSLNPTKANEYDLNNEFDPFEEQPHELIDQQLGFVNKANGRASKLFNAINFL